MSDVGQSHGGLYSFLTILTSLLDVVFIQRPANCDGREQPCYQWWTLQRQALKINKKRLVHNDIKFMVRSKRKLVAVTSASYAASGFMSSWTSIGFWLPPKMPYQKYWWRWSFSATWSWIQLLCLASERENTDVNFQFYGIVIGHYRAIQNSIDTLLNRINCTLRRKD